MNPTAEPRSATANTARLDRTLKLLQARVREQQAALDALRSASSAPPIDEDTDDKNVRLRQLRTLKAAYDSMLTEEPYLSPPDSALPALLALRSTHETIEDTKINLKNANSDLEDAKQRLEREKADLDDANLITSGLTKRIADLKSTLSEQTQKAPAQIGRDIMRHLTVKKAHYDSETGKLIKAFNKFIDNELATMLAAEELGGPVVGGALDLEDTDLATGFNTQGRASRSRAAPNDGMRQRRIDEIWGQNLPDGGDQVLDERGAAAAEMRDLTEQLLNQLVDGGGGGSAYVDLPRESAAARFLVRANVAQFHPRDARKLRLVDFGRDLDA